MTHTTHARDWAEYPALQIGDPVERRKTYVGAFDLIIRAAPTKPAIVALVEAGFTWQEIETYWMIT